MRSEDVRGDPTGAGAARDPSWASGRGLAGDRPERLVLVAAVALTAAASGLAILGGANPLFWDDLQELFAAGGGALALGLASRRRVEAPGRLATALALSLSGAFLGMLAWDLSSPGAEWLTTAGNIVFVVSACVGAVAVGLATLVGIERDRLAGVGIDTLIVFLAGIAVVAALWNAGVVAPGERTASVGAVVLVAASAGGAFALFARHVGWGTKGPWVLVAGATTLGAAWLLWIGHPSAPTSVDLSDFMFSAALLLIAAGGVAWDIRASESVAFDRVATVFNSLLPVAAILGSLALLAVAHGSGFADLLGLATSAVIVTSAVRQLHLYARESRARAALAVRSGELQAAVSSLRLEIAERQRLEAEGQLLQERMLQSQRLESIGRLAGGVAHDFNNLLTAIRGYADLTALRLPPADEGQEDLDAIRHAADQAASLTRQLLAFSRNQQLRPSVVDLGAVVVGVEQLLRRLLGERIELVVQPARDLWPVLVDPGQFESIIVNLAVNARDAMEGGGTLTIEAANVELDDAYAAAHAEASPGAYVMVAVSDTGVGMSSATLAHIFEPFFSTKSPGKGTGLGLASVYGTVRQSGGHVTVSSEEGRGTTFRIYLPRSGGGQPADRGTAPASSRPRGHETVLVVEDEDAVRHMTVTALERCGYAVVAVRTGEDALEALGRADLAIGVLLTDVVMPGMSGIQLVEEARRRRPDLPAICMSGYIPGTLDQPRPDDVTFLGKPFTIGELDETIRHALGR